MNGAGMNGAVSDALCAERQVTWLREPRHELDTVPDPALAQEVTAARERFERFAPWVVERYPDTGGVIESPLSPAPGTQQLLDDIFGTSLPGELWVKRDDALPISGSIKARGGIHEVFRLAEQHPGEKPRLVVCSTGNLGLSIGTVGPQLGFATEVHMSSDAKQWKKERLRDHGAEVVEHDAQFSEVIAIAREAAERAGSFFIDDEDSAGLFAGYAVAGERLRAQFAEAGRHFTDDDPLHVYLPCGVGGGPGGVTFGLKQAFGTAVRCHFVEPVTAPAMFLGQATGLGAEVSCADYGISGRTLADGLAVQRPSPLVSTKAAHLASGFHTVDDRTILASVAWLHDGDRVTVEPSAAAGLTVPWRVREPGTHVVWLTGGSLVPSESKMRTVLEATNAANTWRAADVAVFS